jgi:hypothetical protein
MSQSGTFFSGISPAGPILTLTADTGGPVPPTAGNIDIVGGSNINTVGNAGTSTITVNLDNNVTISGTYVTTGGDIEIDAGNLMLPQPTHTGNVGLITIGTVPFISNYGPTNTFVGPDAGNLTLIIGSAIQNSAFGDTTLRALTTGHNNSAAGYNSLEDVTSGSNNSAYGSSSLNSLISGSGNSCFGIGAGSLYTSNESNNICLGSPGSASDENTIRIGEDGSGSLQQDTCFIAGILGNTVSNQEFVTINSVTGQLGVVASAGGASTFDTDSGTATESGGAITMHGGSNLNTSGAGSTVTYNLDNTVSISGSMTAGIGFVSTTGDVDIVAGNLDLPLTNVGGTHGVINSGNIPYIHNAGNVDSIFIGGGAGETVLTTANTLTDNIGLGNGALSTVITAGSDYNVAIGSFVMEFADMCSFNVAVGYSALNGVSSATYNTAVGPLSLSNTGGGSYNTCLGYNSGVNYGLTESSNVCVANNGVFLESNAIHIGTQGTGNGQQNTCYIAGIIGNTVSNTELVTINSATGQLGVTSATNQGITWQTVTGATNLVAGNGYFVNGSSQVVFTLPATAAVGDTFWITTVGTATATGWKIVQNSGQQIVVCNNSGVSTRHQTTVTTGSVATTSFESAQLICWTANTSFVLNTVTLGNFTIV